MPDVQVWEDTDFPDEPDIASLFIAECMDCHWFSEPFLTHDEAAKEASYHECEE